MIQKIQSSEYLKRIGNMTAAEKEAYLNRAGEWLEKQAPMLLSRANDSTATFQNAVQCSAGWNDAECQAWTEGAQLLTALITAGDTWLPDMLYTKAAKRCIHKMVNTVSSLPLRSRCSLAIPSAFKFQVSGNHGDRLSDSAKNHEPVAVMRGKPETSVTAYSTPFRSVGQRNNDGEGEPQNTEAQKVITPLANREGQGVSLPVRPKHIDQYVHLLPKATQEKAATVRGLLRDLDVARENARKLMNADNVHADKIARWAKTATKLDEKVKAIYKELDAEWEKLIASGRVTVDDFGNAHVKDDVRSKMEDVHQTSKDAEDAKRIEYLKKWLRDTRRKPNDERRKQWKKNCKELLKLGGVLTDSIRKAAEYYGVNLDDINGQTTKRPTH